MKIKEVRLNRNHWQIEDFKERMSASDLKQLFLQGNDTLIFHGKIRQITYKKIAPGVYEVFKDKP